MKDYVIGKEFDIVWYRRKLDRKYTIVRESFLFRRYDE